MKNTFSLWLLSALLGAYAGGVQAEKADRARPMNVEADALRYDDVRQINIFTGRVLLTKGTIQIRGERIEVRQDPQGRQYGVVTAEPGKLAFFRQKREGVDEYIEGEGETIDYDGQQDVVKFIGKAQLRRYQATSLNDEFNAGIIVYNNSTSVFTLDGSPGQGQSGSQGQTGAPPGRVRAMLTPKPQAAASGVVTPLQASPALGETPR